jgi:acid phosphatase type 7
VTKTWIRFVGIALLAACSSTGGDGSAPDGTPAPSTPDPSTRPGEAPPPPGQVDPGKDTPPDEPWNPPVETGAVTFPYTAYRCGYAIRQVSPAQPSATFHEDTSGTTTTVKNLHLTIAGNASSSVVIQWSTDDATKATEVRFGDSPTKLDKIAHGLSFTYGIANRRQHEVHLCGLAPNRTYYYDAGGSKERSKIYKLTTAPDGPTDVKILVAGDTRTTPATFGAMQAAMLASGARAFVLTGDAVATGGTQSQWDALFAAAPDFFAQLPGIWAHGNHEDLNEAYFAQLALPDNGAASGNEEWFATTYGPLRFVVLNDTVSSGSMITGVEKTFLDATLKAVDRTKTPFVVTMHHKPIYTTSNGHDPELVLRDTWAPLFDQYHVDIDLAGHVHSYESTLPINAGAATTDALGTRYLVFGGGGAGLYGFKANQAYMKTRESVHGWALMSASATAITWTAYRDDGTTIESFAIPR